jgi:hypothetical protein
MEEVERLRDNLKGKLWAGVPEGMSRTIIHRREEKNYNL